MNNEEQKLLINIEDTPKKKCYQCTVITLLIANLTVGIASLGNIIYAYQYVHQHDYSGIIKNITKLIHKACEEFQC